MISGGICYNQGMHVDGKVEGNVFPSEMSKSSVSIGQHGVVDGNVYAETLMTNGEITGDLYASKTAQLGASAKVTGNVYYHKLEMAMGAEVVGSLRKLTDAEVSAMVSKLDGDRSVSSDYEVHENE